MTSTERHPDLYKSAPPEVVVSEISDVIVFRRDHNFKSPAQVELISFQEYDHLLDSLNSDYFKMRLDQINSHKLSSELPSNDYVTCKRVLNVSAKSETQAKLAGLLIRHLAAQKNFAELDNKYRNELTAMQVVSFTKLIEQGVEVEDLKEVSSWFLGCR